MEQVYYPSQLIYAEHCDFNRHVLGIELDNQAIEIFQDNLKQLEIEDIDIIAGDVTNLAIRPNSAVK